MSALDSFRQFVGAINSHDVPAISAQMTTDIVFVDSLGHPVRGAASMEAGWRGYFAMCPDYAVQIAHAIPDGETVLAVGQAGGTIDGIVWRIPAAWKAVIRGAQIAEWHVFADNKPVYDILAKRQK